MPPVQYLLGGQRDGGKNSSHGSVRRVCGGCGLGPSGGWEERGRQARGDWSSLPGPLSPPERKSLCRVKVTTEEQSSEFCVLVNVFSCMIFSFYLFFSAGFIFQPFMVCVLLVELLLCFGEGFFFIFLVVRLFFISFLTVFLFFLFLLCFTFWWVFGLQCTFF